MKFVENNLGFELSTAEYIVFFGKKEASLVNLQSMYPHLNFKRLRQYHSDVSVKISHEYTDLSLEGDALYTSEKNIALTISTADCVPVLIVNNVKNQIAAIHSGWRGVAQKITTKTIDNLYGTEFKVFIGPHILMNSFEITDETKNILMSTIEDESTTSVFRQIDNTHYLLDLSLILINHLQKLTDKTISIESLLLDTKKDTRFHSYRRDKEMSGRQLSFVALR